MIYADKELDNVIDISHLRIKVGHPNGTEAYIFKIGNLRLSNGLTLYDVMVILNTDLSLKNVLGFGDQCEGLYYYNNQGIKSNNSTLRYQCLLSQHDWNYRLGHPVERVMNVLKGSLQIDKKDNVSFCEICQRAKQTREHFPLSDHVSKCLGDLVHLNLWGPYKVTISEGSRLPSFVLNGKSPYEMIYKKCPTLSHLRVFGCLCFATIVNNNDKFSSRSEKCVMIGYSNFKKGYRLYSLDKHQFIFLRDVKFFENIFPFKDSEVEKNESANVFQDVNHINFFDIEYSKIPNDDERVANDLNNGKSDSNSSSMSGSNINTADFPVDSGNDADSSDDLVSTQNEEVATLEEHVFSEDGCYESRNGSKWIYKIKFRSNGEINRYKARLVAQVFRQKEGIGYEETFSPVVKMVTVRCLLNIVVSMSWPVFQLDVNNAFLYGDLEDVVFIRPPEGYFPSDNKVCRLKRSLYGLKQAPRQWNAKLTSTLIENGFSQSKSDYSLYTKSDKGVFLALLVYVDDIIINGNNVFEIEKFKVFLKSKFMIKDLGKLKYFLGIEVVDTDKGICLNQEKYVLDLLSEYGMLACKPAKTPLMSKLVISNEASENDPLLENITDYQKLMGKLIYLTNIIPYISYDVHCLSQFMHSPLSSHLKTAFKILRYLKSSPGLGIHIARTSDMFFNAYSDADWAKCIVTRKSVTGYCVFLNNSLVSWKSKKQNTLSKSSTEAEYRVLSSLTSEVIWILKILKDLQIENLLPVSLHCDSNSAIKIAVNPVFHERTKHLEIDLHFVSEKVLKYVVKTIKVDSANQIADILTKGLDTVQHLELVKTLGFKQGLADLEQRFKD
ncbi:ribonuclease H-like domain-containing protein [Tanacetum coccineum]